MLVTVSKLLDVLDLLGTGAATEAARELEAMRRDSDFGQCKDELVKVLGWTINAMREIEENEQRAGLRPQALPARRQELEAMRERLSGVTPIS